MAYSDDVLEAARRLHGYIEREHWDGVAVRGPDPGIRWNARIGRFVKSYLSMVQWSDDLVYMQAQAYWVFANWQLTRDGGRHAELAETCTQGILEKQNDAGFWDYPNPEWRGRIATVEGCFAALALLSTYSRTGDEALLKGAIRWYDFMVEEVGFAERGSPDVLSVNYFAGWNRAVPNNDTLVLWLMAELFSITGEKRFLAYSRHLLRWLGSVQLTTGELPYLIGTGGKEDRPHFLCYQYNAFEFVDLAHYLRLAKDDSVTPVMKTLGGYLAQGVTADGWARYDCHQAHPRVPYYTSALGRALRLATRLEIGQYGHLADHCYRTVLDLENDDGSLPFHSSKNYGILADRRSYPRYLSMVLVHLLAEADTERPQSLKP